MAGAAGDLGAAGYARPGEGPDGASGLLDAEAQQGACPDRQFHGEYAALSCGRWRRLCLPCRPDTGARSEEPAGGGPHAGAARALAPLRCRTAGEDEGRVDADSGGAEDVARDLRDRSEEHTSEL